MSGHDIARDADVLLHDAQYRDDEYPARTSGGATRASATRWSSRDKADVDTLVLFHHDPYHTDDELEALLDDARRTWTRPTTGCASPTRA